MMEVGLSKLQEYISSDEGICDDENGYPARRRSLVDDARFETIVNKETKRSLIEEARQMSKDEELLEEDIILSQTTNNVPASSEPEKVALVIGVREGLSAFARVLKTIENFKGVTTHMESRPSRQKVAQYDILVKVDITREALLNLIKSLRQSAFLTGVSILSENTIGLRDSWYPRHISDLDLCNHLMTKFEPDLDMDHPGFADKEYRARRKIIADIAFNYKYGQPIPRVEYTKDEIENWGFVFNKLESLYPTKTCRQHRENFDLLKRECGFRPDVIPQLEDVSNFLKKKTGFTVRPAAGLLTARDFLASLAFRVFQCCQYVRHPSEPEHSPEPDCIHELLGHIPLLADPSFAEFSQEIGLASLGASDEEIEKFATLYWFTVEFGLCKEDGQVMAYGAGLLSSYGEMLHALSDKPEQRAFDPAQTAVQPYQDQEYQDVYYVAESLEDAKLKFRRWVSEHMSRSYEARYNPYTQSVEILDSVEKLDNSMNQIRLETTHLTNAINKLKFR